MVKNNFVYIILLVFIIIGNISCKKKANKINSESDFEYDTEISGFSGICYNQDKTALLAVSDNGKIYEIEFNGSIRNKLPYKGKNDFEAITINPQTGEIYIADEADNTIYKLNSVHSTTLIEILKIEIPGAISNKGIEGVSYANDTLYIVNQYKPSLLIKYNLSTKEQTRKEITFATYLSDICYDHINNSLWILDSNKRMVSQCDLNGNLISQQEVKMIKKPEALLVDSEKNRMWIACDKTSKLYSLALKPTK